MNHTTKEIILFVILVVAGIINIIFDTSSIKKLNKLEKRLDEKIRRINR